MAEASFEIRDYDPVTDFEAVQGVLDNAGLFDADYDNADRLARWIAIQPDAIVVATVDEEVVGSVYFQDGIIPLIFRLAVHEAHRENGIGTALLHEAEQRARRVGHAFVELFVRAADAPEAERWYRHRGYNVSGVYANMVKEFSQD